MSREVQVGIFVLGAILSLVYVAVRVTKGGLQADNAIAYYTLLPNATGILKDTPIRMAGIPIGKIGETSLSEDRQAHVGLLISENVYLHLGSKVAIRSSGILGDKFIEITPGPADGPILKEGSLIPASEGGGGVEEFLSGAGDVLSEVRDVVAELRKSMATPDENGETNLSKITKNIKDFTQNLKEITGDNKVALRETIHNLNDTVKLLKTELDRTERDSTMAHVNQMTKNLKEASEDLKIVLADIRQGKGTVGKLVRDEETVDKINTALSGVNQFLGAANRLKTDVDIRMEAVPEYDNSRTYLNVLLEPSPGKGYLLGIAMTPDGVSNTTTTETTSGSTTSVEEKKVTDDNKLRFTAQYVHRFSDFRFRLGLMESTGGVGADYAPLRSPFQIQMDAFDYDDDLGINLKLATRYRFYNIFYATAGGDRLTDSDLRSFFIGAGISFTDEDLKMLLTKLPVP